MYIDKYKTEDGDYLDEDNTTYLTAEDFMSIGVLNFCGCGSPKAAMLYVRTALHLLADLQDKVWKDQITYEQWAVETAEFFESEGAEYFMWYYLNHKEFTEHGGSVPGWLTPKGREVLADLNVVLTELAYTEPITD